MKTYAFYLKQNTQYVAMDTAPKYTLMPGFSCSIASVMFCSLSLVLDIVIACSGRPSKASHPAAIEMPRVTPSHVSYHVTTSPLRSESGVIVARNSAQNYLANSPYAQA